MATRVGIELAPDACRIVEIDAAPPWTRRDRPTRIRSFAILPPSGPETEARLRGLKNKRVAVVVWTGGDHRQVMVGGGSYESMRTEAVESLAAVGMRTRGVWLDIAPVGAQKSREVRRPVVAAFASGSELTTALQPLKAAGLRLRTVTTPAAALWSLARLRRSSAPDAIEVYVALEERVSCIATVRGGALLAARDLGWGYVDEARSGSEPRHRDDVARRLADAITQFVASVGGSVAEIGQVSVCGGMPELRSMTAPLTEQLDVEIEPLDSLFGVDAANLPAAVEEFRERGAELRLAWAVVADWPPPINLLRARNRQASKAMLARAAIVTGTAAGLVVGWRVQQSAWWRTATPAPVRTTANVRPAGRASTPAVEGRPAVVPPAVTKAPVATPLANANTQPVLPPAVANKPPVVAPSPVAASNPPSAAVSPSVVANRPPVVPPPAMAASRPAVVPPVIANKPPVVAPSPVAASNPPSAVPPPAVVANRPPVAPSPVATTQSPGAMSPPVATSRPVPPPASVVSTAPTVPRVVSPATPPLRPLPASPRPETAGTPSRARARTAVASDVPLPFDAVLGTILYSPDRKLAIVDGRIVGLGDEIRGARIVDITPNAVMLRDAEGRLRRIALGAGGR